MDPHAVERYAWLGAERRTLSSLPARHQPSLPVFASLSLSLLETEGSQRNYAKSSTRKIRDTTSRRVSSTSTRCIAISREILRDDGLDDDISIWIDGNVFILPEEARHGSSNRNTVHRFTMLSRVNI